jgi:tRNA-2-methylthio-N6-dimethylallyladenosine synthase
MNFSDSEVVASIMNKNGYSTTRNIDDANVVLINTCSIRDNAEKRVRKRLTEFKKKKSDNPDMVVGILGCMAERLKKSLLEQEKLVDLVAGPDAYRDLPNLIDEVGTGQKAVNVLLSRDETYADISPVRLDKGGVSAFVTIMRGCIICALFVLFLLPEVENDQGAQKRSLTNVMTFIKMDIEKSLCLVKM